jgi:hypothetical protein
MKPGRDLSHLNHGKSVMSSISFLSPGMVCMPQTCREQVRQSPGMVCMPQTCREQAGHWLDALPVRTSLSLCLVRALLLGGAFYLSGCDAFYASRIDLVRPNQAVPIKTYEDNKTAMISAVDRFVAENNMVCTISQGWSRDCKHQTEDLVAFEDKKGLSVCLYSIGTGWSDSSYLYLVETLEKLLTGSVQGTKLKVSPSDEHADCVAPWYNSGPTGIKANASK